VRVHVDWRRLLMTRRALATLHSFSYPLNPSPATTLAFLNLPRFVHRACIQHDTGTNPPLPRTSVHAHWPYETANFCFPFLLATNCHGHYSDGPWLLAKLAVENFNGYFSRFCFLLKPDKIKCLTSSARRAFTSGNFRFVAAHSPLCGIHRRCVPRGPL